MATLKLLCSAACMLMLFGGIAYAAFLGLRMTRRLDTGDRRS